MFRSMRHTNILKPIIQIHLGYACLKAIAIIVIAFDKNKLSVQLVFKLSGYLVPALKDKVAQKKCSVSGLHPLIVSLYDCRIHFLDILKWADTIAHDIMMRKMRSYTPSNCDAV